MKRVVKVILKILVGILVFVIVAFGALFILSRCNPELVQRLFAEEPATNISFYNCRTTVTP